jgi:uncharacterized RDD family membrane protein YckC
LKPEKATGTPAPALARPPAPPVADEPMILAQAAPSSEPVWRMEINRKIEAYRVRTGQRPAPEPQPSLPFPAGSGAAAERLDPTPSRRPAERRTKESVQVFVIQTGFDFAGGAIPAPNHSLVPVAGLRRRALAWMIDVGFLVACWAMFVGLLAGLGVDLAGNRIAAAICIVILFLLYVQYFALFTAFGGVTPGMRVMGLRVVSFDGNPPTPKQLLWRSFGYLVAGGAALLGFFWALWDEDRLCWQDRASQTYLTALVALSEHKPIEAHH